MPSAGNGQPKTTSPCGVSSPRRSRAVRAAVCMKPPATRRRPGRVAAQGQLGEDDDVGEAAGPMSMNEAIRRALPSMSPTVGLTCASRQTHQEIIEEGTEDESGGSRGTAMDKGPKAQALIRLAGQTGAEHPCFRLSFSRYGPVLARQGGPAEAGPVRRRRRRGRRWLRSR